MAFPNIFALQDLRWNNAGTTFRGIWLDLQNGSGGAAVGAAASRALRLSNNGTDIFTVDLNGSIALSNASFSSSVLTVGTLDATGLSGAGVKALNFLSYNGFIGFSPGSGSTVDTILARDAANTLAQRNGTNAQTFNLYKTFTDANNYERVALFSDANGFHLFGQKAGTGSITDLEFGTGSSGTLIFSPGGSSAWKMPGTGHLFAQTDNTPDIGASNANRPRNAFLGGALATSVPNTQSGTSYSMSTTDSSIIFTNAAAVTLTFQAASSYFGRWLHIKQTGAGAVSSASSNVVPLAGGAAGTAITTASGKWSILQSDGTNWIIMAAN